MKLHKKNHNIRCLPFGAFKDFTSLLGALALTVAISLSAAAQIVFGPPTLLNTNGVSDSVFDFEPQVATDGAGNWVAVWFFLVDLSGTGLTEGEIFVATSTDNGATWTAPALLNTNAASDSGHDISPQVTTDGLGNWVAVWSSDEDLGGTAGTDWDIFVATSTNNGATWTAPALLNTNGTFDLEPDFMPQVTTDGAGNWVAVWETANTVHSDADIFVAISTNNGSTWTAPALLNTNGISDSGGDVQPQVTTDSAGNWVAVWVSGEDLGGTAGTDPDIFVATSTNNGVTWSAPALLNTNGTSDSGGDFEPQVTTDGAGNWVAVWRSGEDLGGAGGTDWDLFVATSTNNGSTWTAPALLNTNGNSDSGQDRNPQVTTDSAGNWLAVWWSREDLGGTAGTDWDIFVAASTNDGVTWTVPALLNTNGISDSGNDFEPQVTTDGAGNWVAVWSSDEDLGGTAGFDDDIFVATFAFGAAGPDASSGNCFIATAAYGTPLAEEINVLRGFRDRYLLTNALGGAITDAYYRVSPPIADSVASSARLAALVRFVLTMLLRWGTWLLAGVVVIGWTAVLHGRRRLGYRR